MNDILVTFKDDLSTVVFTQKGNIVDPKAILIALANGTLKITYNEVWFEPSETQSPQLMSQTWKIVPAD